MARQGGNSGLRGDAPAPTIASLTIADAPECWEAVGFEVAGGVCRVGSVSVHLSGSVPGGCAGIVSWAVRGFDTDQVDGLRTEFLVEPERNPGQHANTAMAIDHVVVFTPSLDRTAAALDDLGVRLRRERTAPSPQGPVRQGFFRMGEVILEVVAPSGDPDHPTGPEGALPASGDPARFWGLVFTVADLDRCGELLGDRLGPARDAVQPGRRIATLRRGAGLGVPVAFITPSPPRGL